MNCFRIYSGLSNIVLHLFKIQMVIVCYHTIRHIYKPAVFQKKPTRALLEICYGQKIGHTLSYFKVKFNALVTTATFADKSTFAYSLFDLTGKKLNNTIDKVQEYEAGQHYFEYNTSELTQGIYVLKTIVNGEVQSQKIQITQ